METYGTLILHLILRSTTNKHHVRRVTLFKAYGTKEECGQEFHEFFTANQKMKDISELEFTWKIRDERLNMDEVAKLVRPNHAAVKVAR